MNNSLIIPIFFIFLKTQNKFNNCIFQDRLDFYDREVSDSEFNTQGAFYGVTFVNNPIFDNLILRDKAHLYFENLNPDDADLSIKKFSLTNTVINGRVDFSENIIKCLDLKDSVVLGTLTRRNFNPDCANRETATILKNEEIKQNNSIGALKYKAVEKDLYTKWLKYAIVYFKWTRKYSPIINLK